MHLFALRSRFRYCSLYSLHCVVCALTAHWKYCNNIQCFISLSLQCLLPSVRCYFKSRESAHKSHSIFARMLFFLLLLVFVLHKYSCFMHLHKVEYIHSHFDSQQTSELEKRGEPEKYSGKGKRGRFASILMFIPKYSSRKNSTTIFFLHSSQSLRRIQYTRTIQS